VALLGVAIPLVGCEGEAIEAPAKTSAAVPPPPLGPTDAAADLRPPRFRDATIEWDSSPVMRTLGHMSATMSSTEYVHGFQVDAARGVYHFDCSGMVHYVLRRSAPVAAAWSAAVAPGRPLARDFHRSIAAIPGMTPRGGWQRVARVVDALPGDVIAWIKPADVRSENTGHVGFVVLRPVRVPGYADAFVVRIADSTSLLHDDDTRVGRSGFGLGTILLLIDEVSGAPRGFGWVGTRSPRVFETEIAIGRPLR
jgi:hypothetical protein